MALQGDEALLVQADDALELFEQLKAQHRDVSSKTKSLHDSCERLVSALSLCCQCKHHQTRLQLSLLSVASEALISLWINKHFQAEIGVTHAVFFFLMLDGMQQCSF